MKQKSFIYLLILSCVCTACNYGTTKEPYIIPGAEGSVKIFSWGDEGHITLSASFTEVEESITTIGPLTNWDGGYHKHIFGVKNLKQGFSHSPLYDSKMENLAIVLNIAGGAWPYRDLSGVYEGPKLPGEESQTLIEEILQAYDYDANRIYTSSIYWFVHAGLGAIRVKADKRLYGIEPGEDLSSHFKMIYSPELLVKFPTYDIIKGCGEYNPDELSDWQGALLSYMLDYVIKVKDTPTEQYDKVTFTIEVDVQLPNDKMQTISNSITVEFEN